MPEDPELRRLLWFLLGGSRGGNNRGRIIMRLHDKPSNQNQLASDLSLQYKAIQHHVRVLARNSLVVGTGEKYGMTYSLSLWLESRFDLFLEICKKLNLNLELSAQANQSAPGDPLSAGDDVSLVSGV